VRVPIGKVIGYFTPGVGAVLVDEVRQDRARTVFGHASAERMIESLNVDTDQFDVAIHQPLRSVGVEARRVRVIVVVVTVEAMGAGIDHHDVARLDSRRRIFRGRLG